VAFVRSSGSITGYLNGVAGTPVSNSTNVNFAITPTIGAYSHALNGSNNWAGNIDELRISTSARYSANFTPSTTAFTSDANTILLMHMENNFTDDNTAGTPTQTTSTAILVSKTDSNTNSVGNYLNFLQSSSKFIIQDTTSTANYQRWRVTGALTDNTTYYSIPVTLDTSGGTGTTNFADNATVSLALQPAAQGIQGIQGNQGIQGIQGIQGLAYATSTTINTTPVLVANLPAAATAGSGARAFVTNATATTFASIVAGGGSNGVPVYSDGTNWRIG
jgi:hypothetical protein